MVLCLALLLAGCSREADPTPEGTPLGFSTNFDIDSRATAATDIDNMGIFAYYTGQSAFGTGEDFTPDFMFNQLATRTSSVWGYTPLKYWPNTEGDKLTFFAYSPHSDNYTSIQVVSENSDTGLPCIEFTAPGNITLQTDLLVGEAKNVSRTSSDGGAVRFEMHHTLTRIRFSARTVKDHGNYLKTMAITSVSLKGAVSTATAPVAWTGFGWTIADNAPTTDYYLTIGTGLLDVALTDSYTTITDLAGGYDLMLIPQKTDDLLIEVTMLVTPNVGEPYSKSVALPLKGLAVWEVSKTINYQVTLDWSSISELSAHTTGWGDYYDPDSGGHQTIE